MTIKYLSSWGQTSTVDILRACVEDILKEGKGRFPDRLGRVICYCG